MHQPNPSTDPQLIQADTDGMIDRREEHHYGYEASQRSDAGHPVNTDPPKLTEPQEPTTRAEALAQAKEWGSTLSHWNTYCGLTGDRAQELLLCAQADLQEQQRLIALASILPPKRDLDATPEHRQSAPDEVWPIDSSMWRLAWNAAVVWAGASIDASQDEADSQAARERAKRAEKALADIAEKADANLTLGVGQVRSGLLREIRDAAYTALRRPCIDTRVKRLIQPAGDLGTVVGWHHELQLPEIEWDSQRGLPAEACEPHEFTTDLNEQIDR